MISFDVINLANYLLMDAEQPYVVRVEIAKRMVEAAVDIINTPERQDAVLDPLNAIYEAQYDMVQPDNVILGVVKELRQQMEKRGWDARLMAKVTFKVVSQNYHMAMIAMDLDATLARQQKKPVRKPAVRKKVTGDTVTDNPCPEDLNEFFEIVERRSARRTPLLSDRDTKFIKTPAPRGQRT